MDKNLHNIDKLFKDGIEGHTDQPDDFVWNNLDQQLDRQGMQLAKKKYIMVKRSMVALAVLLTIAILLLIQQYRKPTDLKSSSDTASAAARNDKHFNNDVQKNTPVVIKDDEKKTGNAEQTEEIKTNEQNKVKKSEEYTSPKQEQIEAPISEKTKTQAIVATEKSVKQENQSFLKKEQAKKNNVITESNTEDKKTQTVSNAVVLRNNVKLTEQKNNLVVKQEPVTKEQINSTVAVEKNIQRTDAASGKQSLLQPGKLSSVSPDLFNQSLTERTASPLVMIKKKMKPVFSIAASYTPEQLTNHVEAGEKEHREDDKDAIRDGEQIKYAGSFAVQVQYQFNQHWAVLSGVSYSKTSSVILPRNLYARPEHHPGGPQGGGDLKYKLNCTAGYVYLSPKSGTAPAFGDSIQAFQSTNTLEYIAVPLGMKYSYQKGKFAINAVTALNMNILTNGKLQATIAEQTGVKTLSNVKIEGLKPVYFSAMLGIGLEYFLNQRISVFALPAKSFSLSSINKNTPADTKRGSLGLQTGIRFRL